MGEGSLTVEDAKTVFCDECLNFGLIYWVQLACRSLEKAYILYVSSQVWVESRASSTSFMCRVPSHSSQFPILYNVVCLFTMDLIPCTANHLHNHGT